MPLHAPPADAAATPPADANPPATMAATPPANSAAPPPASNSAAPPATGPVVPSFDVVRVEADGSVVVAGKAAPDALVELLNDTQVLGNTDSGAEGDFAIVLDEPLKPGDYQITLRATPKGGAAVMSLETAVLSIPETPGGQVLAMVEEPGKASELLTVPEPAAPAAPKTDEAAAPPAETPVEPKAEEAATPPAETPAEPKVEEAAAPPAEAGQPATAIPLLSEAAPKVDEASPPADAGKPAEVATAPADAEPEPKPAEPAPAPVARLRSRPSRSKATRSSSPAAPIPAASFASTPTRSCSAKPGRPRAGVSWSRPNTAWRSATTSSAPMCWRPTASK